MRLEASAQNAERWQCSKKPLFVIFFVPNAFAAKHCDHFLLKGILLLYSWVLEGRIVLFVCDAYPTDVSVFVSAMLLKSDFNP